MLTGMIDSTPSAAETSSTPKKASSTIDKNGFLMLLVAQLKNQDPTQSQDPAQMVQQMTSFSSLEQAQNTNTLLNAMQSQNSAIFQAQSASLVGKKVRITSSAFDLKSGSATVGVELAAEANVKLTIQDATGKTVATLDKGSMGAGNHVVAWDGKDDQGHALPDGTYSVQVAATGKDGSSVASSTSAYAVVSSVSFYDSTVVVTAGGRQYSLSDINEIGA
jgi:flagellar basal-body rod modification protein FlgD